MIIWHLSEVSQSHALQMIGGKGMGPLASQIYLK